MNKLRIYIGWDSREDLAYQVLRHSIIRRTSSPLEIIPLKHQKLRRDGLFRRPWLTEADTGNRIDLIDGKPFSTEFSHTRFLIPHLNGYKGWALFMDCDMLWNCDVKELMKLADPKYAVQVVKHRYEPKESEKMDGQPQSRYYRKNWSSFVLWNCEHPLNSFLTPQAVNALSGGMMHSFAWLEDKDIGHLGNEWNWIEGCSPAMANPKVIHYTLGGPWFEEYAGKDGAYFDLWEKELANYRKYGENELAKRDML